MKMINIKKNLILVLLFLLPFIGAEASEPKYLELPSIEVIPIEDSQTGRQYELYIKLPESYSKSSDKKYPVIYITDAMWHIEILSGSTEHVVEDAILVGISWQKGDKPQLSRNRDYTFTKSKNSTYQRGEADNHIAFIRNDVIKFVEKTYQTDPNKRTYFGYSVGGAFGAYILLTQPDIFKNYILGSPTVKDTIFKFETKTKKNLNANVYVSYGALETELGKNTENFIAELKSRNYPNLSLELEVIKSAGHGRAFSKAAVHSMYWLSNLTRNKE